MAYSEDHIALAAEYALGTLDAGERTQVEMMMAVDTEFTAVVHAWEYRLGVLNQMVGSVEPRPIVWENIKAAVGHSGEQAALVLPDAAPPAAPVAAEPAPVAVDNSNVIQLSGRLKRMRTLASVATALAAALIAMLSVQVYAPGSVAGRIARQAAHPDGRSQDTGAAGCAFGAICRAVAA